MFNTRQSIKLHIYKKKKQQKVKLYYINIFVIFFTGFSNYILTKNLKQKT